MSVLITGGTGMVGANTAQKFAKNGFDVICYDVSPRDIKLLKEFSNKVKIVKGDITSLSHLIETVEKYDVTGIVHTAAIVTDAPCVSFPMTAFKLNNEGTMNILETARLKDLKVVYVSTAGVYGRRSDLRPLKEEEDFMYAEAYRAGMYVNTKLCAELMTMVYNSVYGLDAVAIRISWGYGPGQVTAENPVLLFLEKALAKIPIQWSSGADHEIEFTYVKDVANGIFLAFTVRPLTHRLFNITGGKLCSFYELAECVKKAVPGAIIDLGPGRSKEYYKDSYIRGPCDITRARVELKYKPTSLETAVKEFADYLGN